MKAGWSSGVSVILGLAVGFWLLTNLSGLAAHAIYENELEGHFERQHLYGFALDSAIGFASFLVAGFIARERLLFPLFPALLVFYLHSAIWVEHWQSRAVEEHIASSWPAFLAVSAISLLGAFAGSVLRKRLRRKGSEGST